ncbi:hypothetical protein BDN72DRAFT_781220, partial [Pluteus cervinus]
SVYKRQRKKSLWNALLHRKSKELNHGRKAGHRVKLAEIRAAVKADIQNGTIHDTPEDNAAALKDLASHCELKTTGARGTSKAAAIDERITFERIGTEFDNVGERTGAAAFAFFTPGDTQDLGHPGFAATRGALDFVREVLGLNPYDVSTTRRKKPIKMNYSNYETSIVLTYRVQLIGWPSGVPRQCPSSLKQEPLRQLQEALRNGSCKWVKLTEQEYENLSTDLKRRKEAGETIGKPRKQRSDCGKKRNREAANDDVEEDEAPNANKKRSRKQVKGRLASQMVKSKEVISESDDDEDDDDEEGGA